MKLFREPLLHFLLIGAVIYLAYGLFTEPVAKETSKTIVISAGEIKWLETAWQKRWNRPPTIEERDGLIEQHIRETVFYREALAMGLGTNDIVIRRRLTQKLGFLAQDLVSFIPPTDEDILAYFSEHIQRYEEPELFTFTQVFIDPDKRGDATVDDAEKIKATLIAQADALYNTAALGDNLMLQHYYPEHSEAEIIKLFGSGFFASLVKLTTGQWHGPVPSGYGVHLVHVHSRIKPPEPEFTEVRERVVQDWERDKREEFNEKFYADLRDTYTIIIEELTEVDEVAALKEQDQ